MPLGLAVADALSLATLLVVDDELMVADVVVFALEDEGFRVLRASNGLTALEQLAREAVALVITDYMMPIMNGIELAEAIQAAGGRDAPPVILMSGAQAHIARQQSSLFAAVFDKPFRMAELVARIRGLIGAVG